MSSSPSRRVDDERGFSLVELVVASTLLLVALAAILGAFAQSQSTATADDAHREATDSMRRAADVFAKDVREANSVSVATSDTLVMATTVNQAAATVTWRTTTDHGAVVLQRQIGTHTAETVVRGLSATEVFVYTPNDPASVHKILLTLAGATTSGRRPVDISTEVTLRNAM